MVGPWRFSNLWHLTCSSRESSAGHDLYGRPQDDSAVWFHIEEEKRKRVTLLLIGNIVFQVGASKGVESRVLVTAATVANRYNCASWRAEYSEPRSCNGWQPPAALFFSGGTRLRKW